VAIAVAAYLPACGNSSSAPATTSTAKTAAWTNVSVHAFDGTVNINWDKASGSSFGSVASTYNLYCSSNPVDILQPGNRIATQYAGTSFNHTDVTNGTRYYYLVTEVRGGAEGPASLAVSATPQTALPAAPYGLKVTALDSGAKLDFLVPTPPNPALVTYKLYRSKVRNSFTAGDFIPPSFPATGPLTYSDALTNGTIYYYAITTVVSGKESGFSPVVSVRPQATVAAVKSSPTQLASFASPTNLSAEPGNGFCTISWSDVAALVASSPDTAAPTTPDYILYWSYSPDVIATKIDQANKVQSGYKLTGLTNGSTYYIQLAAAVKGTDGTPIPGRYTTSPVVSITPSQKTPAIPSGVSATQGSQQVALTWNKDNTGIFGVTYNVYVSTTDAMTPAEVMAKGVKKNNSDSSKTYFTHTGLQAGQTYYYVITAVGEGESQPSSIVSVTL
jgi:fibronectin type 3 domain-containing protein